MSDDAYRSVRLVRRPRRHRLRGSLMVTAASAALGFVAWTHLFGPDHPNRAVPVLTVQAAVPVPSAEPVLASSGLQSWMFDPSPALATDALRLGQALPLETGFRLPPKQPVVLAEAIIPPMERIPTESALVKSAKLKRPPSEMLAAARVEQAVPLPMPRPAELQRARPAEPRRLAARPIPPRTQTVFKAALGEEPSFFERIFGAERASEGALAYTSVESGVAESSSRRRLGAVPAPSAAASAGALTAVYDISARTVYLPNGEAIEAHSGLGPSMDNPRHVHLSMRGATPPGTYDLTEREALFHGVRAIRLNPVGGSGAIHGRVGLLAHTYMLGPSGASNGCVSFRNYDRFLQAFLRGEVRRLVVVAGTRQDGPPAGNSRFGLLGRGGRDG